MRLKPFSVEDISTSYLNWLIDPKVIRFSNQRFCTHTLESASAYVNSFNGLGNHFLGIYSLDTQRLVGTITAYCSKHHQTADMGLLIGDRNCWSQGLGLEAWSILQDCLSQHVSNA